MRCGARPLVVMAAVFWTQSVLLDGVDAKKDRKRTKEASPQQTETLNATISNSEEVGGGGIKVGKSFTAQARSPLLLQNLLVLLQNLLPLLLLQNLLVLLIQQPGVENLHFTKTQS